jgi:antitoxin VapB
MVEWRLPGNPVALVSLNIKDPQAHKLARTLAKETGETMTRAVTEALRERLERVRRQQRPEVRAADLLSIGRRCAKALKRKPLDHGALLYDERGLPR